MFQIRPHALLNNQRFMEDWAQVIPLQGLSAVSLLNGIELRDLDEIWVAGYGLGTLYVFDGTEAGGSIEQRFRTRASSVGERQSPADDLIHLTGVMNEQPLALLRINDYMVAIAEDDPSLLQYAEARALGKLSETSSALSGPLTRPFRDEYPGAAFRAFALGPFPQATGGMVEQFVSGMLAISVSNESLELKIQSAGVWPRDEKTDQRMGKWLEDLLDTPEFRALGLSGTDIDQIPRCTSAGTDFGRNVPLTLCKSGARFNSRKVAEAIFKLTQAEMGEMLEPSTPDPSPNSEFQNSNNGNGSPSDPN